MTASGLALTTVEDAARRLANSYRTLEWAVELLPTEWHHRPPAGVAGFDDDSWSVALNLAHLAIYEERIGSLVLESLASGGDGAHPDFAGPREDHFLREWQELSHYSAAVIMARLWAVRERQIALIRGFTDAEFNRPVTPIWGRFKVYGGPLHSAAWVASKTFQHTWEHGNSVLRVALFHPA